MTEDEVDRKFKQITTPRGARIVGMAIAVILALAVLACVVIGVIALAKAVL